MKARAVIGANFGDEGKGLVTDYLCRQQGAGMVVRFNGGAQAGHTVVAPDGRRHVFSHFGSGSFAGVPTYLSQFFVLNPICFFRELGELNAMGVYPTVYAHPDCLVTTFADMIINQRMEDARADKRHGSCGIGFAETIERSGLERLKITMGDLWNGVPLESRIAELCDKYATFRSGARIDEPNMAAAFLKACAQFAGMTNPLGIADCKDPVFEGAQGLLLDQDNAKYFPHVTRSNTGIKNVRTLCAQAGIDDIDAYYVSRTYLTRHGAGPLPGQDDRMSYADETNVDHPYQGTIRFAPLDGDGWLERARMDFGGDDFKTVLTHCDQVEPAHAADLYSDGPSACYVDTAL